MKKPTDAGARQHSISAASVHEDVIQVNAWMQQTLFLFALSWISYRKVCDVTPLTSMHMRYRIVCHSVSCNGKYVILFVLLRQQSNAVPSRMSVSCLSPPVTGMRRFFSNLSFFVTSV